MTGHILLVEDEPSLRMAIEDALRGRGYEVTSASDGIEGERLAPVSYTHLTLPTIYSV